MNNKGFAITTILYGLLILFCLLLVSLLGIMSVYHTNLEKLIDEGNGARAIIQNGSVNASTFTSFGGTGTYVGDGIYNFSKSETYGGCCFSEELLYDGTHFRLTYTIQKTDGVLKNIGGTSIATTGLVFYLDEELIESDPAVSNNVNPYHNVGDAPTEFWTDSDEEHNVVLEFYYNSAAAGTGSKEICIEPNRGLATAVTVDISNIDLVTIH